ncbi:MAG: Minf_1886 family protein [Verrucomicrobiales bacterium]
MPATKFDLAVGRALHKDERYQPEAYYLIKDTLDYTAKRVAEKNGGKKSHLTGPELVIGFRDHALQEYGPMAATLLDLWGFRKCADIGEIVFRLIDEGVFNKEESDSKKDFAELYDFPEAFRAPFRPRKAVERPAAR